MTTRAVIHSVGAYLPSRIVTNHDLAAQMDTSDEWIRERTGISQRHIAAEGEFTSDLAAGAAKRALEAAGIDASTVELLIVATSTPDDTLPSTAVKVQHKIGMTAGAAFDINAVCSGFVYGLTIADAFIASGKVKNAVVIGAETYSRILNWEDRGTCILFGDGAGAVYLSAEKGDGTMKDRGILYTSISSDGQYAPLLGCNGGVSSTQTAGTIFMQGKDIFRHAVAKMGEAVEESLNKTKLTADAIDWLVPHQANIRILQSTAKRLNLPEERVILTVGKHANTSAASIPLALATGVADGRIQTGNLIATPALGAGLTWGTCLIRW